MFWVADGLGMTIKSGLRAAEAMKTAEELANERQASVWLCGDGFMLQIYPQFKEVVTHG